jgi:hypothetical protein
VLVLVVVLAVVVVVAVVVVEFVVVVVVVRVLVVVVVFVVVVFTIAGPSIIITESTKSVASTPAGESFMNLISTNLAVAM